MEEDGQLSPSCPLVALLTTFPGPQIVEGIGARLIAIGEDFVLRLKLTNVLARLVTWGCLPALAVWSFCPPSDSALRAQASEMMLLFEQQHDNPDCVDERRWSDCWQSLAAPRCAKFAFLAALIEENAWSVAHPLLKQVHSTIGCPPGINHQIGTALRTLLWWAVEPLWVQINPLAVCSANAAVLSPVPRDVCKKWSSDFVQISRMFKVDSAGKVTQVSVPKKDFRGVQQVKEWKQLLPKLNEFLSLTGIFLNDAALVTALWRLVRAVWERASVDFSAIEDIMVCYLLPMVSLGPPNPNLNEVVWDLLQQFSLSQRYTIYAKWHQQYDTAFPLPAVRSMLVKTVSSLMPQLASAGNDRKKAAGVINASSQLASHYLSNPLVVVDCFLEQVAKDAPTRAAQTTETLRKLPPLGADIAVFLITKRAVHMQAVPRSLAVAGLPSPDLATLAGAAGRLARLHGGAEFSGLLKVALHGISKDRVSDAAPGEPALPVKGSMLRAFLEQLVEQAAGVPVQPALPPSDILALAGGPKLQAEVLGMGGADKKGKSSLGILEALISLGTAKTIFPALALQRQRHLGAAAEALKAERALSAAEKAAADAAKEKLDKEKAKETLTAQLTAAKSKAKEDALEKKARETPCVVVDGDTETVEVPEDDTSPEVKDIGEKLEKTEQEIEAAVAAVKSSSMAVAKTQDDAQAVRQPVADVKLFDGVTMCLMQLVTLLQQLCSKEKYTESLPPAAELFATFDFGMAFYLLRPGLPPFKAAPVTTTAAKPQGEHNGVEPASADADSTGDTVFDAFRPILASSSSIGSLKGLSEQFFFTFWRLDLSDIVDPASAYTDKMSAVSDLLKTAEDESKKSGISSRDQRKVAREVTRLTDLKQKLASEHAAHKEHVKQVRAVLAAQNSEWFLEPSPEATLDFVNHFIRPRVIVSFTDALFCAHFIRLLIDLKTPGFQLLDFFNRWTSELTQVVSCCSEREAQVFGTFLSESMANVVEMRRKPKIYEELMTGNPVFHRNYYPKGGNPALIKWTAHPEFQKGHTKWEGRIYRELKSNGLESKDPQKLKNALLAISRATRAFPMLARLAKDVIIKADAIVSQGTDPADTREVAAQVGTALRAERGRWFTEEQLKTAKAAPKSGTALRTDRARAVTDEPAKAKAAPKSAPSIPAAKRVVIDDEPDPKRKKVE